MWRTVPLILGLIGVLAGCSLGLGSASSGGHARSALERLSLVAQESPNLGGAKRQWTTTRKLRLSCNIRRFAGHLSGTTALCDAVAYYSQHVPTQPCILRGGIGTFRRVLLSGKVNGRPVHLAMGEVCNPEPALDHAVQTVYRTAFLDS
jgi:hypothetical protein